MSNGLPNFADSAPLTRLHILHGNLGPKTITWTATKVTIKWITDGGEKYYPMIGKLRHVLGPEPELDD